MQVGSLLLPPFFFVDWFQEFAKDSKNKWKYINDLYVLARLCRLSFCMAQTEIDSSVTSEFFDTIKHFGFRNLSFWVSFQRRQVWGVL
jgi:hypothetical protein